MARARRRNKTTRNKKVTKVKPVGKANGTMHVEKTMADVKKAEQKELTREEIEKEVAKIPEKELFLNESDMEGIVKTDFVPNPNLDPSNPDDIDAINEEALKFRREVQEPVKEMEQEEANQHFDTLIETEEDFLKHFSPDNLTLKIVHDGALVTFHIKPIEPSDDLSKLSVDKDVFADIDIKTRVAIIKKAKGEELTAKEEALIIDLMDPKNSDMQGESLKVANSILSQFVTPPEFNNIENKEERIKARLDFWNTQPYVFKIYLSEEVGKRLGLNMASRFSIFQSS